MKLPETTLAWVHQGLPRRTNEDAESVQTRPAYSELLRLEERPLPKLGFGMALIRVEAAPVNPSDTLYIQGDYGVEPKAGDVPGFEGCGTVVAANVGPYGWWLNGQRVSFGSQDGNGTWAHYVVASAFSCIPVSKKLPVEAAATLIVNPMTAIGLIARAKRHGARAIVANAAGSALGKFLIPLAKRSGLKFIALVRREQTREQLVALGADEVLVTTAADFEQRFRTVCQQLKPSVLLDAVAGRQTSFLMNLMPEGALAIVYGKLDEETLDEQTSVYPVATDADGLVFRKQSVEGYWLSHELHGFNGVLTPLLRANQISKLYTSGVFGPGAYASSSLENLVCHLDSGTAGAKLLFRSDVAAEPTKHPHNTSSPHFNVRTQASNVQNPSFGADGFD